MVATAVRRADGSIAVHTIPFVSLSKRLKLLGLPVLRGALALIESMQLGIGALSYSAEQAAAGAREVDERRKPQMERSAREERMAALWTRAMTFLTIVVSMGIGLLLFFWLPLVLTDLTGARSGFAFNLIDGVFRFVVFIIYLAAISMWGEMKRVFQYHGAEHKSISALEAGDELTPERVATYSRFHPRCGTSFLLLVMIASIFVFMLLGRPETVNDRLERFLFIPLIGGVAFELTRFSGKWAENPAVRLLILPGLLLQRITTREPTLDQLEVAIRSVREVTRESGGNLIPI
jgi:uncharacterized protein YqhQ